MLMGTIDPQSKMISFRQDGVPLVATTYCATTSRRSLHAT
jgi:hypothetical protein